MTSPATPDLRRRTLLAVAAPVAVALLAAGWLLWARADPARQGGFCMNATVEMAGVLRASESAESSGLAPLPDAADILDRVDEIDPARLQVDTPPALRQPVAVLVAELPAHRAAIAAAERQGDPRPPAPDAVVGAFAQVAKAYLDDCR